jgi:hypothetical protein
MSRNDKAKSTAREMQYPSEIRQIRNDLRGESKA